MAEIWTPPPANPSPYGLYGAATVTEVAGTNRLAQGLKVRNINCGSSWVWSIELCADPGDDTKVGGRAADGQFTGLVVGAADDTGALCPLAEQKERAQQILRLQERVRVEEATAAVLIDEAGAVTASTSLVAGLGAVEEGIAQYGFTGVVHAAAHMAAQAQKDGLIIRNGTTLTTPLGNRWAFGGGYDTLGNNLYATGPVAIQRADVALTVGAHERTNERLVVAEREVLVAWECFTFAVGTGA